MKDMKKHTNVILVLILMLVAFASCQRNGKNQDAIPRLEINQYNQGNDVVFIAKYSGPEFIEGSYGHYKDEAHMTSTVITDKISDFLKSNYKLGKYYKVNLSKLSINITGEVLHKYKSTNPCEYEIKFHLDSTSKLNSVTSLEHRGTWVRDYRKTSQDSALAWKKRIENISLKGSVEMKLVETDKGFREYWIIFHDKEFN
jgi:hypothetical protein